MKLGVFAARRSHLGFVAVLSGCGIVSEPDVPARNDQPVQDSGLIDDTDQPGDDTDTIPSDDTAEPADDTGEPDEAYQPPELATCEAPEGGTVEETEDGLLLADAEVFIEPLVDTEYWTYLFGLALAGGFDWNGDGVSDLMTPSTAVFTGPFDETTNGSEPYFVNTVGNSMYSRVSPVPDLDGDGYDEVVIDFDGELVAAIVLLGPTSGAVEVDARENDGLSIMIKGEDLDGLFPDEFNVGRGIGDVNRDGFGDLLVGMRNNWSWGWDEESSYNDTLVAAGAASLFYGPLTSSMEIGAADITVYGPHDGARFGSAADAVGDLDGDGLSDFAFGGVLSPPGAAEYRTGVWIAHGPLSGTISAEEGTQGGIFTEPLSSQPRFGLDAPGLAPVGDADGDGLDDFVIGATYDGIGSGGGAYLIVDDVTSYEERSCAHTIIYGSKVVHLGSDFATVGDIDGDGLANWAVGTDSSPDAVILVNGAPGGTRTSSDADFGHIRYLGEDDEVHIAGDQIDAAEHWTSRQPSGLWVQTSRGALLFTPEQLLDAWVE